MSKMEFGRKGPEGIKGEGCTGWDELRYAPPYHERSRGGQMLEQAEEIDALLASIDTSEEGLMGDEEVSQESRSTVMARLEDIRRKKAEEGKREIEETGEREKEERGKKIFEEYKRRKRLKELYGTDDVFGAGEDDDITLESIEEKAEEDAAKEIREIEETKKRLHKIFHH